MARAVYRTEAAQGRCGIGGAERMARGAQGVRLCRSGVPWLARSCGRNRGIPQMSNLERRFWTRVDKNGPLFQGTPCWLWTGTITNTYGYLWIIGKRTSVPAHRIAYEILIGPIPSGLQIDHLCRNRICVNPAHLEVVTRRENILRGIGPTAIHARSTHCPRGHEYDYIQPRYGFRRCRKCMNAWRRNKSREIREAATR